MLPIDLTGRHALISGVSSGIGLGIAKAMSQSGCTLAGCGIHSVHSKEAKAFRDSTQTLSSESSYFETDLMIPNQIDSFVTGAAEKLGGVDFVISNAGRNIFEGIDGCSENSWNECMNLDLSAHWRFIKAAKPWLERSEAPVVIIISSNHSMATIPGCFPYNVAKAGLNAMVQSFAIEWGPKIRTIGLAPGFIDTPGNETWFQSFPDPQAERLRTASLHPVGRLGTVDEIGALCAFLCSSHAAFISGTTIVVDGGRSALLQDPT
jgi:NAD(P)-dependent dehydrogenase (short-subunit alcohol dehydrogenase family)